MAVLGLEEEQVQRRAAAADACAAYHYATGRPDARAATMSVLGASCWVLIDQVEGARRWQTATERYAELAHPYADVLAVCAGLTEPETIPPLRSRTALALQCRLILLAWLPVVAPRHADTCGEELAQLSPLVDELDTRRPGQLGLPVRHVRHLAHALCDGWREHGLTLRAATAGQHVLRLAADTVRAARADRYHWRRLLPGFMPVEPEWLALGRVVYEASARAGADLGALVADTLDPLERLPLVIAELMPPPTPVSQRGSQPGPFDGGGPPPSRPEDRTDSSARDHDQ
jgi:hypothetical protein